MVGEEFHQFIVLKVYVRIAYTCIRLHDGFLIASQDGVVIVDRHEDITTDVDIIKRIVDSSYRRASRHFAELCVGEFQEGGLDAIIGAYQVHHVAIGAGRPSPISAHVLQALKHVIGWLQLVLVIDIRIDKPVDLLQQPLLGVGTVNWTYYGLSWVLTIAVTVLGIMIFNKVEKTFMDTV